MRPSRSDCIQHTALQAMEFASVHFSIQEVNLWPKTRSAHHSCTVRSINAGDTCIMWLLLRENPSNQPIPDVSPRVLHKGKTPRSSTSLRANSSCGVAASVLPARTVFGSTTVTAFTPPYAICVCEYVHIPCCKPMHGPCLYSACNAARQATATHLAAP